jgi:hypothetical protein
VIEAARAALRLYKSPSTTETYVAVALALFVAWSLFDGRLVGSLGRNGEVDRPGRGSKIRYAQS